MSCPYPSLGDVACATGGEIAPVLETTCNSPYPGISAAACAAEPVAVCESRCPTTPITYITNNYNITQNFDTRIWRLQYQAVGTEGNAIVFGQLKDAEVNQISIDGRDMKIFDLDENPGGGSGGIGAGFIAFDEVGFKATDGMIQLPNGVNFQQDAIIVASYVKGESMPAAVVPDSPMIFNMNTNTVVPMDPSLVIKRIVFFNSALNLTINVGTTPGGDEYVSGLELAAGENQVAIIERYTGSGVSLYFTGIINSVSVKIYFE